MKAMLLQTLGAMSTNPSPLVYSDFPTPVPKERDILVRVIVCGVCHTELDEIEGRTPPLLLPVIPGHQVIGRVEQTGSAVTGFTIGDRAGIGWIYSSCGSCAQCSNGNENLCEHFRATGRDAHGGYAQYMTVNESFAFHIPDSLSDTSAAPMLCAGAIGYRSLTLTNLRNGKNLGLFGFGASNHLVLKMAKHLYPEAKFFVFTRSPAERAFALEIGAVWSGDITDVPSETMDYIIDTTPVWKPVVESLKNLSPGGRLVINAIRKEEKDKNQLLNLDYPTHLWKEKEIKSVANITRKDIQEFLSVAGSMAIEPEIQEYSLEQANEALQDLKNGKIRGAKVLRVAI